MAKTAKKTGTKRTSRAPQKSPKPAARGYRTPLETRKDYVKVARKYAPEVMTDLEDKKKYTRRKAKPKKV